MPDRLVLPVAPQQREVLRQALEDAVYYQDPPVHCSSCETVADEAAGGLCAGCATGLARARSYLALSRELGLKTSG